MIGQRWQRAGEGRAKGRGGQRAGEGKKAGKGEREISGNTRS